jgi:hypothetical protein
MTGSMAADAKRIEFLHPKASFLWLVSTKRHEIILWLYLPDLDVVVCPVIMTID